MRNFSKNDENKIKELCELGYSRTYISKLFGVRNSRLENFCNKKNIILNSKGSHIVNNSKISGYLQTKFGLLRFNNGIELYYLNYWNKKDNILNVIYSSNSIHYNNEVIRPNFAIVINGSNKNHIQLVEFSNKKINRPISYDNKEYVVIYIDEKNIITMDEINLLVKNKLIKFDNKYYNKKFGVSYEL